MSTRVLTFFFIGLSSLNKSLASKQTIVCPATVQTFFLTFILSFIKKKKWFIGLYGQIFGTILGNFSIFINLTYLFIF